MRRPIYIYYVCITIYNLYKILINWNSYHQVALVPAAQIVGVSRQSKIVVYIITIIVTTELVVWIAK